MKPDSKKEDYKYLKELESRIRDSFYAVDQEGGEAKFEAAIAEFSEATALVANFNNYVSRNTTLVKHLQAMSSLDNEMQKKHIGYNVMKVGNKVNVRLYSKATQTNIFVDQFPMKILEVITNDGVPMDSTGFWLTFAGHLSTLNETFAVLAYKKFKQQAKSILSH